MLQTVLNEYTTCVKTSAHTDSKTVVGLSKVENCVSLCFCQYTAPSHMLLIKYQLYISKCKNTFSVCTNSIKTCSFQIILSRHQHTFSVEEEQSIIAQQFSNLLTVDGITNTALLFMFQFTCIHSTQCRLADQVTSGAASHMPVVCPPCLLLLLLIWPFDPVKCVLPAGLNANALFLPFVSVSIALCVWSLPSLTFWSLLFTYSLITALVYCIKALPFHLLEVSSPAQICSVSVSSPVCRHASINSQLTYSKLLNWTWMVSSTHTWPLVPNVYLSHKHRRGNN